MDQTIVFTSPHDLQKIQDFFSMENETLKRIMYYEKMQGYTFFESSLMIKEDKIHFSKNVGKIVKKKNYYIQRSKKTGFTFDKTTKKLSMWFAKSFHEFASDYDTLIQIFQTLKIDWFNNKHFNALSKKSFEKILAGKITSQEVFIKHFIKEQGYKVSYKLMKQVMDDGKSRFSFKSYLEVATNQEDALEYFYKRELSLKNYIYYETTGENADERMRDTYIVDSVNNAIKLNKKINFKWSTKRLKQEHDDMVAELMLLKVEQLSDETTPALEKIKDFSLPGCTFITTEKRLFVEGHTMKHCVYTNYKHEMESGRYFIFHLENQNEKATLSLVPAKDGLKIHQCYGVSNSFITKDMDKFANNVLKKFENHLQKNTFEYSPADIRF